MNESVKKTNFDFRAECMTIDLQAVNTIEVFYPEWFYSRSVLFKRIYNSEVWVQVDSGNVPVPTWRIVCELWKDKDIWIYLLLS